MTSVWPSLDSGPLPASSSLAQSPPTFCAHSLVQWSSITFFCAGRQLAVPALVDHPHEGGLVERACRCGTWSTLSMPNSGDRPPREGDGVGHALLQHVAHLRRRQLHAGAAERGDELRHGAVAGRIFMPLISPGTVICLALEWNVPIVQMREAELHVLHLLGRVLAIPGVERRRAAARDRSSGTAARRRRRSGSGPADSPD